MASGIGISTQCKTMFEQLQQDKTFRYIIFDIKNKQTVEVETVGDRESNYDNFLRDLRSGGPEECRFAVYDYDYMYCSEGEAIPSPKEKLFLMMWCPVQANIRDKMLYSSSFIGLKKALGGNQKFIQATDSDELCRECVEEQLRAADEYECSQE